MKYPYNTLRYATILIAVIIKEQRSDFELTIDNL